ncbi:MAG: GFA family protein [Pseudomonadota bacterium]
MNDDADRSWVQAHRRSGALQGHCLCKAVVVRVSGRHLAAVGICHCRLCQRWNGTIWGAFEADPAAVTISGEVARYASTEFSERAFCPRCGTHLWLRDTDSETAPYELMPGLFDGAAEFPLISEIYTDRAPAYAPLAGEHRRKTRAEYEANNRHIEGNLP